VRREVIPTVPVTVEYSLTGKGRDFHTVIEAMEQWAAKWGITQRIGVNES
jgi:DNA-binding HxlR family transcriptional regulator